MIVDEIDLLRQQLAAAQALLAQAERDATANQARLQSIADNLPGMVYQLLLRPDGSLALPYVSDGCRELFGLEPQAIERDALALVSLIHPDDLAPFQRSIMESAASLSAWRWEGRFVLATGHTHWIEGASRPRRRANGDILWDGVLLDIMARKRAESKSQMFQDVAMHTRLGLLVWHLEDADDRTSLRLLIANPAASAITGVDLSDRINTRIGAAFPGLLDTDIPAIYARVAISGELADLGEVLYGDEQLDQSTYAVHAFPLPGRCVGVSFENITERKRTEKMLRQSMLQEEIISAQAAALAELSTPLLTVANGVVVMPLIGTLDSRRAQQVIEALLSGVAEQRAHAAILDITGVQIVDTQVANVLLRAAQAVRLLGARVVLTGIRPEVAQTLIGLGVNMDAIVTRSSLQSGIAYALGNANLQAA